MRFRVRHHTQYRYDVPVQLGPHLVRLMPRPDRVQVRSQRLRVSPAPVAQRDRIDVHGNHFVDLTFNGSCQVLALDTELDLDTLPPPDLTRAFPPLPWPVSERSPLGYHGAMPAAVSVSNLAAELAREAAFAPVAFLDRLTQLLHRDFGHEIRPSGDAHAPEHTLSLGRGACRDLAVLFISACRSLGMPCRFVSGYQAEAETPDGRRYLHAWPEVWLPEVGFAAWDPTHGLRVGEQHVPLCAAAEQASTMPVEGGFSFTGEKVTSTLAFTLEVNAH